MRPTFLESIVGVDLTGNMLGIVRANKRFKGLEIEKWKTLKLEEIGNTSELEDVKVDVGDTIVTNLPMDMVLFPVLEVVPGMKREEIRNYARIMASRNLGLQPDGISADVLGIHGNKGVFAVARLEAVRRRIDELEGLGIPEPDVVVPDAMKYAYLLDIPAFGELLMVVVNFEHNYTFVVVFSNREIVAARLISMELDGVFDAVQDHFGLGKDELLVRTDLEGLEAEKNLREFLEPSLSSLAMEIDREVRIALKEGIKELNVTDLDVLAVFAHPMVFEEYVSEAIKKVDVYSNMGDVTQRPGLRVPMNRLKRIRGALGLILRGGYELGKVKSVYLKG